MTPWTVAYQAPLSMKLKGCHFLLRGKFLIQGWNLYLLHWQAGSLPLSHQGSPVFTPTIYFLELFETQMPLYMCHWVFPKNKNFFFINLSMIIKVFPGDSDGEESTCNAGDLGSLPGLGRSPGGGHGNPLQYSCLENPMDRGAWWAIFHGVSKSWTQLNN